MKRLALALALALAIVLAPAAEAASSPRWTVAKTAPAGRYATFVVVGPHRAPRLKAVTRPNPRPRYGGVDYGAGFTYPPPTIPRGWRLRFEEAPDGLHAMATLIRSTTK